MASRLSKGSVAGWGVLRITRQQLAVAALLGLSSWFAGCDRSDPLGRLPLSGNVTWQGEPLTQGNIQFVSQLANGMRTGALIDKGQYAIPAKNGLVPGEYQVMIYSADTDAAPVPMDEAPGPGVMVSPDLIPAEYNRATTLKAVVEADQDNRFDFDLLATPSP